MSVLAKMGPVERVGSAQGGGFAVAPYAFPQGLVPPVLGVQT